MRVVDGKHTRHLSQGDVATWNSAFAGTTVDLGAGDGRFIAQATRTDRAHGGIGVDLCEASLRAGSRRASGNALFVVADALTLPEELQGVATCVTINFPWGSLLRGLLGGHQGLISGFTAIGRDETALQVVLNAGALGEAGWSLETGTERVRAVLRDAGVCIHATTPLGHKELRRRSTTWAKRLAFGRDPRAMQIDGALPLE